MKKTNYQKLEEDLYNFYSNESFKEKIGGKFDSLEWKNWKAYIKDFTLDNKPILSESTGNNACFTVFNSILKSKTATTAAVDFFYIHKSIIGNYVTFYGVRQITTFFDSKPIRLPKLVICSPTPEFSILFSEAWKKLTVIFPDLIYVPYSILTYFPFQKNNEIELLKRDKNIYNLLFGYGGEISKFSFGDQYYYPPSF